ncbi:MAG: D-tyrosyl-tRNA(Tyr) deacylase [Oleiphilaceae bacterium]|jgi:D-tyrosyl-tRNA(Tyr) deacylase
MKALIQRVTSASVKIEGEVVGEIAQGLLLFLGVEKGDDKRRADILLEKIIKYRVFSDQNDRMNLSLTDIQGELLIVSQFTLVADTQKGLRPSFSSAALPDESEALYQYFVDKAGLSGLSVTTGRFGADMAVSLVNDGPVTFNLCI